MTNREIHDLAEKAYARFGSNHRIGYHVRWQTRELSRAGQPEYDVAGYMSKADAVKLARLIAKAGYKDVSVNQNFAIDKPGRTYEGATIYFSETSADVIAVVA